MEGNKMDDKYRQVRKIIHEDNPPINPKEVPITINYIQSVAKYDPEEASHLDLERRSNSEWRGE
jgi:hypothetical protein